MQGFWRGLFVFGLAMAAALPAAAQRASYPPAEFQARREALCKALGPSLVLMFGATMPQSGVRFRQDNDFFYLTGNEDLNAALVLESFADGKCEAALFVPAQTESQLRVDGPNALKEAAYAKTWGFAAVQPLYQLDEYLARRRTGGPQVLHVRLSERDEVDFSRKDKALYLARRAASAWGTQPSEDAYRVELLKGRHPFYELRDISPFLDALRLVKSPREIEVLRRNGRVSAEGIKRAIAATRAGRYEYELEAEAQYVFFLGGAEANGYHAIVGSGPNVNVWHYDKASRQLEEGDLVVM